VAVSKVHLAGFFRELRHGAEGGPSLKAGVGVLPAGVQVLVADYLDRAPVLAATSGLVDDVLDSTRRDVCRLEIATDGLWAWPRDLGYYVRNYAVSIPEGLVRRAVAASGWPPKEDDLDLLDVEERFFEAVARGAGGAQPT
jgi:hypothetical protein